VWNFSFEDTRESKVFEMLQDKVESIRGQLGNTADVLGMLDDINVDSLIMESIRNDEPASATKEELEELIDERQRTLAEWYERSLIDTTTFDEESRRKIQDVMDQSEDVYGSEADLREFFERGISALGGDVEKAGNNLFRAELPESLRRSRDGDPTAPSPSIGSSRWTTRESSTSPQMRNWSKSLCSKCWTASRVLLGSNCSRSLMTPVSPTTIESGSRTGRAR